MKRSLLVLACSFLSLGLSWSQCVFSCYNYSIAPTTYSIFPSSGPDVISSFLPNIDDGVTSPIPIGFNFTYYCATYTDVLICSNGFIVMDITNPPNLSLGSNPAQAFPNSTNPNGIIALNMNDFDPNMGGSISYTTVGVAPNRMFVVTYTNVPMWSCNNIINRGQIILFETSNRIEIHTGFVGDLGNSSAIPCYPGTQGIENPAGTTGTVVSGLGATYWTTTAPMAYAFVPIASYTAAPLTASITGTTAICQGQPTGFTLSPNPGASSYNWTLPFGWTGTSTQTTIATTSGQSGSVQVTATYSCGTTPPVSFSVTVIPAPVVSISSATPNILCSGITVTFNTSGAATYTLQPGNYIGTPPFFDTPAVSTGYTLTGTNSFGCVSQNQAAVFITVKETPTVQVNSGQICLGATFQFTPTGASTYVYYTPNVSPFPSATPNTTGVATYSVVGTSTNGCVANTAISTVTVHPLPFINAVLTRPAICSKESTSLTAFGGISYTWSANTNSTTNTATIIVKPTATTVYTVEGVDANGCASSASVSLKISSCSGINEFNNDNVFSVYPNPSDGEFMIRSDQSSQVSIYDLIGQVVYMADITNGSQTIDLKDLQPGTYFLQATFAEEVRKMILIIQ